MLTLRLNVSFYIYLNCCYMCFWNIPDCIRGFETQSFRGFSCWSPRWWGSRLQEDPSQSWRCPGQECVDPVLGKHTWFKTLDFEHCLMFFLWRTPEFLLSLFFISRVWTSQPTSSGPWLRSGRLWSSLMSMSKPQTTTHWGFSASPSPRDVLTKSRELAMLNPAKSVRYIYSY